MQQFEVVFYAKANGNEPAKEFILKLDKKMRVKMLRTIQILAQNGPLLREPYSKALDNDIFELRGGFGYFTGFIFFHFRSADCFN